MARKRIAEIEASRNATSTPAVVPFLPRVFPLIDSKHRYAMTATQYSGLTVSKLRELIDSKEIPAMREGNKGWKFFKEDLDAYLDKRHRELLRQRKMK